MSEEHAEAGAVVEQRGQRLALGLPLPALPAERRCRERGIEHSQGLCRVLEQRGQGAVQGLVVGCEFWRLRLQGPVWLLGRPAQLGEVEQAANALQPRVHPFLRLGQPGGGAVKIAALMGPTIGQHEGLRQQVAQGLVGAVAVADKDHRAVLAELAEQALGGGSRPLSWPAMDCTGQLVSSAWAAGRPRASATRPW